MNLGEVYLDADYALDVDEDKKEREEEEERYVYQ